MYQPFKDFVNKRASQKRLWVAVVRNPLKKCILYCKINKFFKYFSVPNSSYSQKYSVLSETMPVENKFKT